MGSQTRLPLSTLWLLAAAQAGLGRRRAVAAQADTERNLPILQKAPDSPLLLAGVEQVLSILGAAEPPLFLTA
jgi:hypothetical protein